MTSRLKQVEWHSSVGHQRQQARIDMMSLEVPEVGERPAKKRRRKRTRSKRAPKWPTASSGNKSMAPHDDNHKERKWLRPVKSVPPTIKKWWASRSALVLCVFAIVVHLFATNFELNQLQASASTLQDFDGATFYKAPVGSRVRIACNATNWWDDSISLVLWFKGSSKGANTQPIYTIDARQRPLSSGQARHLVADPFKGRARFVLPSGKWPASNQTNQQQQQAAPYLDLAPLMANDQGEYRCRVDYRQRPRENFLIILFVLVPPSSVEIMDATGRPLEQIYGPLNEGAELTLLCLAKGGRPAPLITWRRNGRVIDESYLTLNDFLTLRLASQRKRLLGHSPSSGGGGGGGSPQASLLATTPVDLSDAPSSGDKNRILDNNQRPNRQQRRRRRLSSRHVSAGQSAWPPDVEATRHDSMRPLAMPTSPLPQSVASDSINLPATLAAADRKCERDDDDDVASGARSNPSQSTRLARAAAAAAAVATLDVPDEQQLQQQKSDFNEPTSSQPANWLAWPEFAFFQLGPDEFFYRHANKLAPTGNEGGAAPARARTTNSSAKWQRTKLAGVSSNASASPVPLIEAQVGETITTAVNVLHLAELSRAHLVELGGAWSSSDHNDSSSPAVPKLECHASNLHYDLRSLIKMFAPPSLQANQSHSTAGGQLASSSTASSSSSLSWMDFDFAGPQEEALAESIEAALWANLASLNYAPADEQQQQQAHEEGLNASVPLLAAQKLAANDNLAPQKSATEQRQQTEASLKTTNEDTNWPALIQQQLIRPHQLGSVAAATAAASASQAQEPTGAGKTSQRAPGQPGSELSRNKLIALEALLRPLDVKVTLPQRPLVAGQVSEFTCTSNGSRPPARLSWFKNGLPIGHTNKTTGNSSQQVEVMNVVQNTKAGSLNSTSQSKLSLRLTHEDHQTQLSCRAENEAHLRNPELAGSSQVSQLDSETISLGAETKESAQLSGSSKGNLPVDSWALEDSITLDVHYTPRVKLELGNRMLREQIREGQDIFFSCLVDAQPAVYEISWLHNERPINETRKRSEGANEQQRAQFSAQSNPQPAGGAPEAMGNSGQTQLSSAQSRMIVSNNSLVLQRVQIDQRGRYACMATNSEGVGLSNPIDLRVLHAPICVEPPPAGSSTSNAADHKQAALDGPNELDTSANRRELLLGKRALRPSARSKFKCHMLAEPADSLEFTWYLNNSFNERRLLFTSRPGDRADAELEAAAAASDAADNDHTNLIDVGQTPDKSRENSSRANSSPLGSPFDRPQVASSQLLFGVDSELDYGRLYCVAKNSIGEQQRACVYTIEPAGPNGADQDIGSDGKSTACLAVNVTSHSAWIGCDEGNSKAKPTQLDQNNEPTRNPARRFKFNVRVFSLETGGETSAASAASSGHRVSEPKHLEAKLTSDQLNEPLFALANLRPATSYLLEIEPLDSFDGRPLAAAAQAQSLAIVRLTTTPVADELVAGPTGDAAELGVPVPSIRQVTEPHRADLLAAALISTRSTSASNSHLHHSQRASSSSGRLLQAAPRTDQSATGSSVGWWHSLATSLASLFHTSDQATWPLASARSRQLPAGTNKHANQAYSIKWLHLEPDGTLALLVCILLLAITLIGLIALRRLWSASNGSRLSTRRRSSSSGSGASNKKRTTDGSALNAHSANDDDGSDEFDMKMSCLSGSELTAGERQSPLKLTNGIAGHLASTAADTPHVNKPPDGSGSISSTNYSALGGGGSSAGTWTRQNQRQLELARNYSTLAGRSSCQQSINFLQPSVLNSRRAPSSGQLGSHAARNQETPVELADANQQQQQQPHGGASRSRSSSCLAGEASLEIGRHLQQQAAGQAAAAASRRAMPPANGKSRASRLIHSSESPPTVPPGATSCSLSREHLRSLQQGLISDADFFLNPNEAAGGKEHQLQHQMLREQNTLIGSHAANNACVAAASNQQWHFVAGHEQPTASPMSSLESPFGLPACSCTDNSSAASNDNRHLALVLAHGSTEGHLVSPMVGNDEPLTCWSQLDQGQPVGVVEIMAMMQGDTNKLHDIDQLVNQQQECQQTRTHQANTNHSSSFTSSSFGTPPHLTFKDSLVSPPLSFTTNTTLSNTTDSYQANNNIILFTTPTTDAECDASTTLILDGSHSSGATSNSTRAHRSILRKSGNQKSAPTDQRHERNPRSRTPVCQCDNTNPN